MTFINDPVSGVKLEFNNDEFRYVYSEIRSNMFSYIDWNYRASYLNEIAQFVNSYNRVNDALFFAMSAGVGLTPDVIDAHNTPNHILIEKMKLLDKSTDIIFLLDHSMNYDRSFIEERYCTIPNVARVCIMRLPPG